MLFCRPHRSSDKTTDCAAGDELPTWKSPTFNNFQFQAKPDRFIFCVRLIHLPTVMCCPSPQCSRLAQLRMVSKGPRFIFQNAGHATLTGLKFFPQTNNAGDFTFSSTVGRKHSDRWLTELNSLSTPWFFRKSSLRILRTEEWKTAERSTQFLVFCVFQ